MGRNADMYCSNSLTKYDVCVCFLRETTFSEFDVDLILLLFIESYFILQCIFFFLEKSKKTWWSMGQSMGPPMGELRFCINPDV